MISLLNKTCSQIIVRNSQIVLGNVRHFICRFSRWLSDMEIIRLSDVQIWMLAKGIISSHPRAHFLVCATDFCYFSTRTLKFIILRDASYGSSLAENLKQRPSGRPSGPAGVSYVSAVNVSLATRLLFPHRLITAWGVKKSTRQGCSTQQSCATGAVSVAATTSRLWITIWLYMKIHTWNAHQCLFGLNLGTFWWKTCQTSLKR